MVGKCKSLGDDGKRKSKSLAEHARLGLETFGSGSALQRETTQLQKLTMAAALKPKKAWAVNGCLLLLFRRLERSGGNEDSRTLVYHLFVAYLLARRCSTSSCWRRALRAVKVDRSVWSFSDKCSPRRNLSARQDCAGAALASHHESTRQLEELILIMAVLSARLRTYAKNSKVTASRVLAPAGVWALRCNATQIFQNPLFSEYTLTYTKDPYCELG